MMTQTKSPYGQNAMAMAVKNRMQNRPPGSAPAPMAPGATNAAPAQYPMGSPAPAPAMGAAAPAPMAPAQATGSLATVGAPAAGMPSRDMGAMAAAARSRGGGRTGGDGERDNPYEDWQRFDPRNPKQWQKYLMRTNLKDYFRAYPMLWEQINELRDQANTSRFDDEGRAQFLAPYMQNIEQQTGIAQGALDQAMGDRGLTDSSANALGQSNILSRAAQARSGAVHDLYQTEEQRQKQAQQELMAQLQSISGRGMGQGGDFANIISQMRQQALMQQRAQPDDNIFGDLFGALGGIAGMAGGMGWNPLARAVSGNVMHGQAGSGGGSNIS